MSSETETLTLREESVGKRYPLILERFLLLSAVIGFFFLQPYILDSLDGALGIVASFCALPLILLFCVEMIGRIIQSLHASSK